MGETWLYTHAEALWWLGLLSALMFVGTLLVLPALVVYLPVDYFTRPPRSPRRDPGPHRALHVMARVGKNILGILLLVTGIAMLILPGQGLLTMLLGLTLLNFPGKRALEWRLVRHPMVWNSLNWIRARRHQPALEWPATEATPPSTTPTPPTQKP